MAIEIRSGAFGPGEPIPRKYTGDGQDLSPPITWSELPPGAVELALICDDPDAPTAEPWVHWVIYHLPVDLTGLPEGVEPAPRPQNVPGALQGVNSWSSGVTIGYRGPAPPPGHGVHHYHFTLYVLDTSLETRPGLTKNDLLAAMSGHVIVSGRLIGTYERPRR